MNLTGSLSMICKEPHPDKGWKIVSTIQKKNKKEGSKETCFRTSKKEEKKIQHHELPRWSPTPVLNGPVKLNFAIRNGMRCRLDGMAVSTHVAKYIDLISYLKLKLETSLLISLKLKKECT
jgi:hypothetical protein